MDNKFICINLSNNELELKITLDNPASLDQNQNQRFKLPLFSSMVAFQMDLGSPMMVRDVGIIELHENYKENIKGTCTCRYVLYQIEYLTVLLVKTVVISDAVQIFPEQNLCNFIHLNYK